MNKVALDNYNRMRERLLEDITIKCRKCGGSMVQVYDIWDESYVGYSCKSCPHYLLFTSDPQSS